MSADGEYVGVSTSEMRTLGKYWVKGSSINSKRTFLVDRLGEAAAESLDTFLSDHGAPQVLEASWYPFQLYDDVLRFVAREFLGGDLKRLRDVGRHSARQSLTGTYSVFVRPGGFRSFLERSAPFHGRYYSAGSLQLVGASGDDTSFELVQEGAPIYTEPDLEVACGFYCEAAEMMGLWNVTCEYEYTETGVRFLLRSSSAR
ncbi:MAG: hypothetical protein MPN21_14760 [Thermoanaerobaculia bacterium]|nr:hypothetical protein [Thermoanaerobaculia bacterium]